MKATTAVLILLSSLSLFYWPHSSPTPTQPISSREFDLLREQAETYYAEKSYQRAHETYLKIQEGDLSPSEKRWVEFRLADTSWRAAASTKSSDPSRLEAAKLRLLELSQADEKDAVWPEIQESLGDFLWTRQESPNWHAAWGHYQAALEWWASSRDLSLARERYLSLIWKVSDPGWQDPYYSYGYHGNYLPPPILQNVLKIAEAPEDVAHANYLMARTLTNQGNWPQRRQASKYFEDALRGGRSGRWFDDALYHYAQWMATSGEIHLTKQGQWQQEPNYPRALELFRRLLREFSKGETRYYDQAQQQIREITAPRVGVTVSNIFLPGSEIQFQLSWRNTSIIHLYLYEVDLNRDLQLDDLPFGTQVRNSGQWLEGISPAWDSLAKQWTLRTENSDYRPAARVEKLDDKLAVGAYLLVAKGSGQEARELVLVSDVSLVLKSYGDQALLYFCSSFDGAPLDSADFSVWRYSHRAEGWESIRGSTTRDGTAEVSFTHEGNHNHQYIATAALDGRQAFAAGYGYRTRPEEWRVYVTTDRPTYRPLETVHWKMVARRIAKAGYQTPVDETLYLEITDPRGSTVRKSDVSLNSFGSSWDSLELTESLPLGEYQVNFWTQGRRHHIGRQTLFRLEEYKLPEFRVDVQTPTENGRIKTFRVGDEVKIGIAAEYYFGGAVVGAQAEVVVYQRPFYPRWQPPREFPWLFETQTGPQYGGWRGQEVRRETLVTDADGKAFITLDTSLEFQDLEFEVEARVRDSSRREVVGSGSIRVSRQRYFTYLNPDHHLYSPGDEVAIAVRTLNANNDPIPVEGTVTVQRSRWVEVWVDAEGSEIRGDALRRIRSASTTFPPSPQWRLKFSGYEHEDILTRSVTTDEQGQAELEFATKTAGYYTIAWVGDREEPFPVQTQTQIWAADGKTTELGYRYGGVQIILDDESARVGRPVPILLVTPTSNRHVLFSVETNRLLSYQTVHVQGTAKLIELDLGNQHIPNVFLKLLGVSDQRVYEDMRELIVPPLPQSIRVELETDREEYEPRTKGRVTVKTTDANGQPLSTEVALGVVDESVYSLQSEYASDPLRFFFGQKRNLQVQTQTTSQQKPYARLVTVGDGVLLNELDQIARQRAGGVAGGVPGGVIGGGERSEMRDLRVAEGEVSRSDESGDFYKMGASMRFAAKSVSGQIAANAAMPAAQAQTLQHPAVQVRSDFRTTILWTPTVMTDARGHAIVPVRFNDSLTTWRLTARAVSANDRFGQGAASVLTNKPLLVRLQAPRFFVVGDKVTVSAVVNNRSGKQLRPTVQLEAAGSKLVSPASQSVSIDAGLDARVDWVLDIDVPGRANLKVVAWDGSFRDAMEKSYPAFEHGIEKALYTAGKNRDGSIVRAFELPPRKTDTTEFIVQVTPSLAVTMLDALPYLIDYPYGCTEQTMSRFLPTAIVSRTLGNLGLEPEDVLGRVFGGIVPDHAARTHPKGRKNLEHLDRMIEQGLQRLYDFQHSDGGWGWWKEGESDHFMTAYVLWGLSMAREAEVDVRGAVLSRAAAYLDKELVERESSHDLQAWMLHSLTFHASKSGSSPSRFQRTAFDNLWDVRDRLNAYSRALLALSAHQMGRAQEAGILIENLENGAIRDEQPQNSRFLARQTSQADALATVHWGNDGIYYRWSEGGVEATSFVLRALLTIDPENTLVEPTLNWLIKNRRGAQWSNTRDTAIVVLTLTDYLEQSGELEESVGFRVTVNGQEIAERSLQGSDLLTAPSRFRVDPGLIQDHNQVQIRRTHGSAPLYYALEARFFSLEEPIQAAGNEVFVQRSYYRLVPSATLLNGHVLERELLKPGQSITSGDRLEVVLQIEAKNHYEYLLFEDLKPAGLEAVALKSGGPFFVQQLKVSARNAGDRTAQSTVTSEQHSSMARFTGQRRWVHRELRDRKVALFIDKLPEGFWEMRYELRAEVPGDFHALPLLGHAMYVPEIRANGEEMQLRILDSNLLTDD